MSSSKVFKQDQSFTRTALVQHKLILPGTPPDSQEIAERESSLFDNAVSDDQAAYQSTVEQAAQVENEAEPDKPSAADIEAIREEAFHQGINEQKAQFHDDFKSASSAFTTACQKIDTLHESLLEQSRGEIINLAIALSRKIIGRELDLERDAIAKTLETALENGIECDEYFVSIHPDDLETAEQLVPDLINSISSLENLVFKTNREINRGGCILESKICVVDATIEAQLEGAREFLKDQAAPGDMPIFNDDSPES